MRVVVDIRREWHEIIGMFVLRPRNSKAWVNCDPNDTVEAIAQGVREAVEKLRDHLHNCRLVAMHKKPRCAAFVEIGPIHHESVEGLFQAVREAISCPPELGFRFTSSGSNRIVYVLHCEYDPARVCEAPRSSHFLPGLGATATA